MAPIAQRARGSQEIGQIKATLPQEQRACDGENLNSVRATLDFSN